MASKKASAVAAATLPRNTLVTLRRADPAMARLIAQVAPY